MNKYWHVLAIGVQNTLVYRLNSLFRSAFGLIPLVATLSLWRVIYEGKAPGDSVGGYPLAQMVSYYLLVTIVDALTAVAEDDWQIASDIKDGNINHFLIKPIDYLAYRLCLYASGRLVYCSVAALPVALFVFWLRDYFVPPADVATFALFLVSVVLAALLQFFIAYTMALLAFWVLEVATFIFIQFALEYIASGHMFPLDILPPAVQATLQFLPFPYLLYFPVSIYLGRVTGDALVQGFAAQVAWVGLAFLLARWVWSRGIRRYSAVGG
jgi:ABC-2 type transport system permease protein